VEVLLRSNDLDRGRPLARGVGSTKKLAEQDAARLALERLAAKTINLRADEAGEESERLEAE
jgi:dsRNA-specific ribonuclease